MSVVDVPGLATALLGRDGAELDQMVEDLTALVQLDAPSHDVDALAPTARLLEDRLRRLGARVDRHPTPAGTHIEATFGAGTGAPILLMAHYDTVWPRGTAAERPLRIEDGIAHGPGTFDMRGGIVAALGALRALGALGALSRPVTFLLTADEEVGSESSRPLIEALGGRAAMVLIPEPPMPDGGLKVARKGLLSYRLEVRGRAAHAGLEPERGVSAIDELLDLGARLKAMAEPARGTTVNIGKIAGGSRPNVIAAEASAEIDVRTTTLDEHERMEDAITSLRSGGPAELDVVRLNGRPPMERTAAIAAAAERVRALGRLLGLELGEGAVGGASDGNFIAPMGVPIVDGLGPRGDGAHALEEHIVIESLMERSGLMALAIAAAA